MMMKTGWSFKVKLQMILLTVSLTAIFFLGLAAYQSLVAFREGKADQLRTATEGWIDKIDRNLFERYGDIQAYAVSDPARSMNPQRIMDFMTDMMITYAPVYDLMIVTDINGKVIAVSPKTKKGEDMRIQPLMGADMSNEAWFKAAIGDKIKAGTSFVEDLHIDENVAKLAGTNGRVMNFTAPIRDKQTGQILGVWTNRMSWTDVVEAITNEETEKIKNSRITASYPALLSSQGVYLLHPLGDEFEMKKNSHQKMVNLEGNATLIQERNLDASYFSGKVVEATAKSRGYSSYPGNGWQAILQVPASDSQTENNNQLIGFAFLLIVMANALAFWIIRRMGGDFESVVARMTQESSYLTTAANQISTASQQLSESTTEQAAAIEETAASMEEITSMLGQTTQNAAHCKGLSEEGQAEVQKGKEVILRMSSAMEEISAANSKLDRLVSLIEDIKNKTKIINDIVSETRLLSFNASIEAARAGAHGKGFAVVAEEVGKLAAISGKAADEIRELLDSSMHEVSQVVKETQDRVNLGQGISQDCEVAFNTMGKSLERVNELIRTIASAAKEQEVGIKQTNKAMAEMDKVTQGNSRGAEVLSEQAETLHSGAESLNHSIEKIQGIVLGHSRLPASAKNESPARAALSVDLDDDVSKTPEKRNTKSPARSDSRWKGVA